MSLHYLLDGYNILNQMPSVEKMKLQTAREHLVALIEEKKPQGHNRVTVVFDGQPDVWGEQPSGSVKVIFTSHGSADSRIKKMVAEDENPRALVIVTDDKEIRFYVRSLGAEVMWVKDFLERMKDPPVRRAVDEKPISKNVEVQINEELSSVWLKRKKPKE